MTASWPEAGRGDTPGPVLCLREPVKFDSGRAADIHEYGLRAGWRRKRSRGIGQSCRRKTLPMNYQLACLSSARGAKPGLLCLSMLPGTDWRETMAEALVLICDVCGRPATGQATVRWNGRNYVKDLCAADAAALVKNARAPKRGRKPKSVTAIRKTVAKKTGAKRGVGRPRKTAARKIGPKRTAARGRKKTSA
jgi:hypothetical protein